MAYTVVTGSRRNPQRSAATGTPIRLESQWPLYYGYSTPVVTTTTTPTTTTEEDTSATASEVGFAGAGGSPIGSEVDTSGLGPDTAIDALAYDILGSTYSPGRATQDILGTISGPAGALVAAARHLADRARAYDLAEAQTTAGQSDIEGGAAPGYSPSDLSRGGMRQTETGGWGFTGASEEGPATGIGGAGIGATGRATVGDFNGAYGDFGFGDVGAYGEGSAGVGGGIGGASAEGGIGGGASASAGLGGDSEGSW